MTRWLPVLKTSVSVCSESAATCRSAGVNASGPTTRRANGAPLASVRLNSIQGAATSTAVLSSPKFIAI